MDDKNSGPLNIAAERAVLAGLCQFGQELFTDISSIVSTESFSTTENKCLYTVLSDILQESATADLPSILSKSTVLGYSNILLDQNNMNYIKALFSFKIAKENSVKNAVIIKKLEVARCGRKLGKDIYWQLSQIDGSESLDKIISILEQPVFAFTTSLSGSVEDKTQNAFDGLEDFVNELAAQKTPIVGIPSPFPIYNSVIGGGRRAGYVYLIAARPKTGKSSFAVNDAVHVTVNLNIPVLYLDTEMSLSDTRQRLIACMTEMPIADVEQGKFSNNEFDFNKVRAEIKRTKGKSLSYRKVAGKSFDEVLSTIRRWIIQTVGMNGDKANPCMVIYDYFKLTSADALKEMQEFQAIGFQLQSLTDFCNNYGVSCSAYVQESREGLIAQSDRLLWFCASVAYLKRKSAEEIMTSGPLNGNMKLVVTADQRFGPGLEENDWINLGFDKDKCKINELNTRFTETKDDSFQIEQTEDNNEPEFTDEDFDKYDFGDDRYRKN